MKQIYGLKKIECQDFEWFIMWTQGIAGLELYFEAKNSLIFRPFESLHYKS
jgi:hypothetical protein